MNFSLGIQVPGKLISALILFVPISAWAQQSNHDQKVESSIIQSADSLRKVARFDSSNVLYQHAAEHFDQQGNGSIKPKCYTKSALIKQSWEN